MTIQFCVSHSALTADYWLPQARTRLLDCGKTVNNDTNYSTVALSTTFHSATRINTWLLLQPRITMSGSGTHRPASLCIDSRLIRQPECSSVPKENFSQLTRTDTERPTYGSTP